MSNPVGICAAAYTPTWTAVNTAMREASTPKRSIASTLATPNDVRPKMATAYTATAPNHTKSALDVICSRG